MLFIAFAPFGAFAFEGTSKNDEYSLGDVKHYKIFENSEIPRIMYDLRQGNFEIVDEIKKEWEVEEVELSVEYTSSKINPAGEFVRNNVFEIGQKYEIFEDMEDFLSKMNEWGTQFTKLMMKKSSEQKDKLIV